MRYNSTADGQYLRKRALGPVAASAQRRYAMSVPGRGLAGLAHQGGSRTTLRGFGATNLAPVGAGAGAGAAIGAEQGASIGSAVPVIGTAIGAIVGAIAGAVVGSINKVDPENYDFDAAVALWQQNPNAVYTIGNPYLALAGLFDLNIKTNIPIYKKFGHMGEAAFVVWLCNTVYQAAQSGQISANDTALTVMSRIVQPQIDAWGYGAMSDPHADLITRLIQTMILQYTAGMQGNWYSVGGTYPTQFNSIPKFPGVGASANPTASATPSPVTAAALIGYSNAGATITVGKTGQNVYLRDNNNGGNTWQLAPTTGSTAGVLMNGTLVTGLQASTVMLYGNPTLAYFKPNAGASFGDGSTTYVYNFNASSPWQTVADPLATPAATVAANVTASSAASSATGTAASTASTASTATATTAVSSTPPAIGATITYVQDNTTGKMIALPTPGAYAGLTSTGGWLVTYTNVAGVPNGTYDANNGVLGIYGGASTTTVPSGYTQTPQTVLLNGTQYPLYSDSLGNLYVWTGGNMIPYSSAGSTTAPAATTTSSGGGGGGGGYYSAPNTSAAQDVTPIPGAPAPDNSLLWIGAAVGAFLLMGGT